jgi:uncharacterized protein
MIFDPIYLLFALPGLLLALWAAWRVRATYAKYSEIETASGTTGQWVARALLDAHGLQHVPIEERPGELSDHYDPRDQTLRLSTGVYRGRSVAAVGIAAHEAGHAIQHATKYLPLAVRGGIAPIAMFGPNLALIMFGIGLFAHAPILSTIAIFIYVGVVVFALVTLPVELNASKRAMRLLGSVGVLSVEELPGARKVLTAAALTYVAAAIQALLTLLYMLMRRRD